MERINLDTDNVPAHGRVTIADDPEHGLLVFADLDDDVRLDAHEHYRYAPDSMLDRIVVAVPDEREDGLLHLTDVETRDRYAELWADDPADAEREGLRSVELVN